MKTALLFMIVLISSATTHAAEYALVDQSSHVIHVIVADAAFIAAHGSAIKILVGGDNTMTWRLAPQKVGIGWKFGAGPIYLSPPNDRISPLGTKFMVGIRGDALHTPVAFQWNLNGVPIVGATNPVYAVTAAAALDSGAYTVTVTDSIGNSLTSDPINVTVQ